jgi:hypothetical protein
MLHLQRKKLGLDEAPISPSRDTYTEGFNDAVDMVVRWMQAEEMGNEHEKA